jgi:hypothetical protein
VSGWVQPAAALIVLLYLVVKSTRAAAPLGFLGRMALLSAAAWLVEETVIAAYGFYSYSKHWNFFLHHVPLLIVLIWPIVIHSAWDLSRSLLGGQHPLVPIAAAAIVFWDAALIEPVAVSSGLWMWSEPGVFAVPPIGVLGWALFAGLCVGFFQRRRLALVVLGAPLATHLLLLATWWGLFRWCNQPLSAWPALFAAWAVSLSLVWLVRRSRNAAAIPLAEIALRAPAAVFFFALLAAEHSTSPLLIAYALAFASPYIALLLRARAAERV